MYPFLVDGFLMHFMAYSALLGYMLGLILMLFEEK
jgi:hypothetical protein